MKYIMVTDFENHWDKIPGNFTSYSPKMVKLQSRNEKLVAGTDTIFIKKSPDSDEIENAWMGKVRDIEKMPGKIFFRVEIDKVIDCPEKFRTYGNGWYIEE
jgi:hypothetical protein